MADFVEKVRHHFRGQNTQRSQFEDTVLKSVKEAASAGAALASAALIVAQGCPTRYVEVLITLYTANQLPCPDFSVLFDKHMISPESKCHSAPEETQESSISSILRHFEDIEELPASEDEVIDIQSDFDTFEGSTQMFVSNDSLMKYVDHQVSFDTIQSVINDSLLETNEQCITFNSNYYMFLTLSSSNHDLEDWFDENLSVYDLTSPITDDNVNIGNSPLTLKFSDSILNSSTISPIATNRITTFSTQADSLHRLKVSTPGKPKHSVLRSLDVSPIQRALSSPVSTTKSTKFSRGTSMAVGARKSLNMGTTKSTTVVARQSTTNHRTQSSIVENDDEEPFLIISVRETPTGFGNMSNRCNRNHKPYTKRNWLMNYIV